MIDQGQQWALHFGDCIEHMPEMPPKSVDFSIFSPPFPAMYSYTPLPNDIGNSEDLKVETRLHLSFFFRQLARVMKPGRVAICHVAQIPRMKRAGGRGMFDFRGLCIRIAERAGLTFEYDWSVRKNPQSQAIRTKSRELQFSGLESDRARSRGAMPDYLLKFVAPGENAVPIRDRRIAVGEDGDAIEVDDGTLGIRDYPIQVTRNDWIKWAECCWTDISETDTLNTSEAKGPDDVKHICPLQLEVIRRCVLLYSNPGELVFSPFAGVGSEGYMALGGISQKTGLSVKHPRRFYGCELKDEYYKAALGNLARAVRESQESEQLPLFA